MIHNFTELVGCFQGHDKFQATSNRICKICKRLLQVYISDLALDNLGDNWPNSSMAKDKCRWLEVWFNGERLFVNFGELQVWMFKQVRRRSETWCWKTLGSQWKMVGGWPGMSSTMKKNMVFLDLSSSSYLSSMLYFHRMVSKIKWQRLRREYSKICTRFHFWTKVS